MQRAFFVRAHLRAAGVCSVGCVGPTALGGLLMAGHRLLSHTEIASALSCQARHAFAYTGHLTEGHTLRRRSIPRRLSEGRAWGVAAALWHEGTPTLLGAFAAAEGLRIALDADEAEMFGRGVTLETAERVATEEHLMKIFAHYAQTATPLNGLERLEFEVVVPIPSRTGRRRSSRFRFQCFLDGWTYDDDGRPWLVEFKLRSRLSSVQVLQSARQIRWYAWALEQAAGISPVGVLVDERLNVAPGSPRTVQAVRKGVGIKGRTVSHAADQAVTTEDYLEACREYDVEANPHTVSALNARVWQQRVPILFRDHELEEAGAELVSAAKLIRDLDSGELYPIRNAAPHLCNGCAFREICPTPDDELYVETLYEARTPKRLRESAA